MCVCVCVFVDGKEFLKGLHTAGLVLYYPQKSPDWVMALDIVKTTIGVLFLTFFPPFLKVYLKPRAITRELLHMLDPDGSVAAGSNSFPLRLFFFFFFCSPPFCDRYQTALMANKAADLAKLEEEYENLSVLKRDLDAKASRSGHRWTWGVTAAVTGQGILMARLIWWDLSWDVMEPIAYLLSFSYMTLGWAYFVIARDDIAEYGTLAGRYIRSAQRRLYAKANFSEENYKALETKIADYKRTLKLYGVVPAKEKKDYPIPHGVLRADIHIPQDSAAVEAKQ